MTTSYKIEAVKELANKIKAAGYRVFIAKSGTYGFYTDASGSRVVSFHYDLGGFKFSGNYKSSQPRSTGTGWQLVEGSFADMFNQSPTSWAIPSGVTYKLTTLEQHMATYQGSSKYVEQE